MSFPRYGEYKDSGVEWLGEVPAHWGVAPLGGLCEQIQTGPFGSQLHSEDYIDDGVPVINPSNIIDAGLVADPSCTVTVETAKRLAAHKLTPGDIVFARRGEMGRCAIVTDDEAGWLCGTGSLNVRLRDKLGATFTAQFLSTAYTKELLKLESVGSTMDNLNTTILSRVRVPAPPVAEQTAIAAFLDRETGKIDALVAEQKKLIALLKEKRQAVISHAVTKGLNPDAAMKPSGIEWLGDVPAHWEVKRLSYIARVQTGVAKGKDYAGQAVASVPYLRVANVQDGYLDLEDVAMIEIAEADWPRYRLQPGDVLMNEGGDFDKLGRGHVWRGEIAGCIHQNHVFAVRPTGASSEWLSAITGSDYAQFYFMTRSKQSTNLASISSSNLMELPVLVPPPAEQAIVLGFLAETSERFDKLMAEAERAIALLKERRSALISAAVTGQIDVRGLVAA